MQKNHQLIVCALLFFMLIVTKNNALHAQPTPQNGAAAEKKWYDTFSIRGYAQIRYNRLLETNPDLKCEQCDRSWGNNGGFFIRRTRIIFSGQINPRVYFYIQPDFASSASSTGLHFGQLRDAYFDVGIDQKNEYRFRIGQSKIPFGFENMQSSQNRIPLDRNDALNSGITNERDLGVFFYYAPESKRKLFGSLIRDGLKGSGDYGVFAIGAYNGQTANKPEQNNEPHVIARLSYPFELGRQVVEPSLQVYAGKFVIDKEQLSAGTKTTANRSYTDQRAAASLIIYPKPIGLQAEYVVGRGPEFDKTTDSIVVKNLHGGYATVSYLHKTPTQTMIPFVRVQYYQGGKKHEKDARSYNVNEVEMGIEWQPVKQFELTAVYTISKRKFEDFGLKNNLQQGSLLRLQAQVNF
jgi:hypothetical protein